MIWAEAENIISDAIHSEFIFCKEYQDKYFLMKQIRTAFPKLPESIIYSAIDYCNSLFTGPVKKKIFVRTLLNRLLPQLKEMRMP